MMNGRLSFSFEHLMARSTTLELLPSPRLWHVCQRAFIPWHTISGGNTVTLHFGNRKVAFLEMVTLYPWLMRHFQWPSVSVASRVAAAQCVALKSPSVTVGYHTSSQNISPLVMTVTVCYWKWLIHRVWPIPNGDSNQFANCKRLPEGNAFLWPYNPDIFGGPPNSTALRGVMTPLADMLSWEEVGGGWRKC